MESLYVGDLHSDVTESMLLEKFSSVGKVQSIHLSRDKRTGASLQHAYINFQQRSDAERALELLNFEILLGQPMRIMWLQMDSSLRDSNKGNMFIKNLEKSIDSMALYDTFSVFGKILSCKVVCDENGSRGYGYVHFESVEAAEAAITRLNGMLFNDQQVFITHFKSRQERQAAEKMIVKDVNSKEVYVCQEQEKEGRHSELKYKFEQRVNLCVRNLDVSVDDERLREAFSPFGTIINAKVVSSNGCSRGFGFVRYSSPEEATKAMRVMQGRMLVREPLHITLIQRKEGKQASISSQGTQPAAVPSAIPSAVPSVVPAAVPSVVPAEVPSAVPAAVPSTVPAAVPPAVKKAVSAAVPSPVPSVVPAAVPSAVKKAVPDAVPSPVPSVVPAAVPSAVPTAVKNAVPAVVPSVVPATFPAPVRGEQLTRDKMGGQDTEPSQATHTAVSAPSQKQLTIYMLESADLDEQIRMLYEHMFPLVEKINPTRAKAITCKIIQGQNNYNLLNMIRNPKLLRSQVEQIVSMLWAREAGQDVCLP